MRVAFDAWWPAPKVPALARRMDCSILLDGGV